MSDPAWTTDVLGAPYAALTIPLRPDDEGEVVATLVRRPSDRQQRRPHRRAVLHVHGFADYFFQTVAADWWTARGYDFYALDLRKYGRSLRDHQTPNFVDDLATYYEELELAHAIVADQHDDIVLSAHSTGGLVVPLWLQDRKPTGIVGVFLNAPWLEMNLGAVVRTVGTPAIDQIGRRQPKREIPRKVSGDYARSLHRDYDGEWDFDLRWKPLESFPVYAGWLRAIRRGHARVHRGIDVGVPVLVVTSTRSGTETDAARDLHATDVVLDVEQIRRWAPYLGRHVTLVQVEGAMHDVTLSPEPARGKVFDELGRWVGAYLP